MYNYRYEFVDVYEYGQVDTYKYEWIYMTRYREYTVDQGSPTLLLESYRPADFSSNLAPTHLSEMIKQPWTPWLAGSGVFDWGWSWDLQDGSSPGAGLETAAVDRFGQVDTYGYRWKWTATDGYGWTI